VERGEGKTSGAVAFFLPSLLRPLASPVPVPYNELSFVKVSVVYMGKTP
jgi:hypothetical protein